ncbi:MAG: hypothetical protein ABSF83_06510 [Nitrososphaerales archaeon]|jgi:hypothetical protein
MNSRGFLELVIAATACQGGPVDRTLFSMVVFTGITTTTISPITARLSVGRRSAERKAVWR